MEALPLPYLAVFSILVWVSISLTLSHFGGWNELARIYRSHKPFTGKRWYLQSVAMRWLTGYGNCITVGVNTEGLHMSVLFPFRAGHPPLFVPWSDVSVTDEKLLLFFDTYRLTFKKAPDIPFIISKGLGGRIKRSCPICLPPR